MFELVDPTVPSAILDPAGYVTASLRRPELSYSVSIRSTVVLDAVADTGAASGEAAVTDTLSVLAEGDYVMSPVTFYPFRNGPPLQAEYPSFHLRLYHRALQGGATPDAGAGTDGPSDAELEAVEGRFITDTTGHNFKLHETNQDLLQDLYPGQRPNLAVFLSLALSGGRVVETHLPSWLGFAPGEVRLTGRANVDGSELQVFEASRTRLNGDVEEWTFWISYDGLPRRIEFAMSNERRPERNIRSAELEFLSMGDCREGYACGG